MQYATGGAERGHTIGAVPDSPPTPKEIAAALGQRLVGQAGAVREISIALSKRLAGLGAGNVLLIGSSGTGKDRKSVV